MYPPKKILVPTDFSVYSDNAFKEALKIGEHHNSKIYLIHVIPTMKYAPYQDSLIEQAEEQSRKFAEERLQKIAKIVDASKVEVVFNIKKGHTAETILAEQEDKEIDMIVMAPHGMKGFIDRLGSVSERVLRGSKVSVLLIK